MQDLDNNMDDLFRKAAEGYRLKPGKSDWLDIVPELSNSSISTSPETKKNIRKKNTLMLLFLFLFMVTTGILIQQSGNKKEQVIQKEILKRTEKHLDILSNKNYDAKDNSVNLPPSTIQKHEALKDNRLLAKTETVHYKNVSGGMPEQIKSLTSLPFKENSKNIFSDEQRSTDVSFHASELISKHLNKAPLQDFAQIGALKKDHNNDGSKHSGKLKAPQNFYFGLAAGASYNEIKNQIFTKPGFNFGAVAGYKLNNKAAIESGLFFSKKLYYTEGKYFNMKQIGASMPANMKVLSVEGKSTVFEIPVMLQYNWLQKNRTKFSSSAGFSSFILTNEKNNYLMVVDGNMQTMKSNYKKASRYFAATFDVSLGIEYKIGKQVSMRLQPYMQIPLKGLGVGALPVTSAGVRVGILKLMQ